MPPSRARLIARDRARAARPLEDGAAVVQQGAGALSARGHYRQRGPIERGLTTVAIPIASGNSATIYPLYCSAISSALPGELIKRELAPMMKKIAEELRVVLPAM